LLRPSSFEPLGLQRNSLKNISDPMKSLPSLVLYHSLSIFQSPCTLFIPYSMCLYLNPLCSTLSLREYNWLLYTSPPVWKQYSHGKTTSEPYKPTFHGGHLSRNISHGGVATLWIFHLPWRRYFYSTRSSMTELLLSVSQH